MEPSVAIYRLLEYSFVTAFLQKTEAKKGDIAWVEPPIWPLEKTRTPNLKNDRIIAIQKKIQNSIMIALQNNILKPKLFKLLLSPPSIPNFIVEKDSEIKIVCYRGSQGDFIIS